MGLHEAHHITSCLLTTAPCRCCSEVHGPTRNLLTSQFLTPAELRQILQHCYGRGDRQGTYSLLQLSFHLLTGAALMQLQPMHLHLHGVLRGGGGWKRGDASKHHLSQPHMVCYTLQGAMSVPSRALIHH
jgi:hypothetical protein